MSSKIKWRESFQKAQSQSQGSFESQGKKTSLLEEDDLSVSDEALEEYLGTLKQKSGLGRLWKGNTFDKVIDRTPDVSISSVSDGEGPGSELDKSNYSDNDFRPNILDLSHSRATEDDKTAASEPSSIKPMEAVHMISDLELSEGPLELGNNAKLTVDDQEQGDLDVVSEVRSRSKDLDVVSEVRSRSKDLGEVQEDEEEPRTLDEVTEEIEEDVQSKHSESASSSTSLALSDQKSHKKPQTSSHSSQRSSQHSSHHQRRHSSKHSSRHSSHRHHKNISTKGSPQANSRKSSRKETYSKSDRSYTDDFSGSSQENTVQESLHDSTSYTSSISSTNMKSQSLSKRATKKKKHRSHQDASTQVDPGDITAGQRLGIGMAMLGPSLVHHRADPSPIACHAVSADAVEALTVYNPAVVALTDMIRQQLRLVEQFVDNSRRMYESYTSNLNTSYNYTTLEDTMKYIQENEPFARK